MCSYESDRSEFRPKPSWAALFVFGIVSFLLSDLIHAFLTWGIETVLAWNAGWKEVLILNVPVLTDASSPFYVSPPLGVPWIWSGEIVATSFLVLAAALVFFWPTRITLASRLFAHLLAIVLLLKGTIASTLVSTDALTTSVVRSQAVGVIVIILALALLVATQRRLLIVLYQFWEVRDLVVRANLFAVLELPGLALLGAVFWFSGFRPGAVAAAITALPLLIAQMLHRSGPVYERVKTHELTGATIALTLVVLAGLGSSIWAFGSDLIDAPKRALTWSSAGGFEMKSHEKIFSEQLRDPEAEETEEEMRIRWSNQP